MDLGKLIIPECTACQLSVFAEFEPGLKLLSYLGLVLHELAFDVSNHVNLEHVVSQCKLYQFILIINYSEHSWVMTSLT